MPFNSDKFDGAAYRARTEAVSVPALASFFDKGEEPEIIVKGLDGMEAAAMRAAPDTHRTQAALALVQDPSASVPDKAGALSDIFKLGSTPAEASKHIELLVIGVVEPKITRHTAVKLYSEFNPTAIVLVSKILELSALGHEPGKPKRSGETAKSAQH